MVEPRATVNVSFQMDIWELIAKEINDTKEKPGQFINRIAKDYFRNLKENKKGGRG